MNNFIVSVSNVSIKHVEDVASCECFCVFFLGGMEVNLVSLFLLLSCMDESHNNKIQSHVSLLQLTAHCYKA